MSPEEIQANVDARIAEYRNSIASQVKATPPWKLYLLLAVALFALVYLAWSLWGKKPPTPDQGFVPAKPAVAAPKVSGPVVKVPLKIVPKQAVQQKYPEAHVSDTPDTEVIDTADIPPAPNGATAITTINTETGEASTEIKIKEAPWFAFERNNTFGIGYEIGTQGTKVPVYYRRDVVRVKDVHVLVEVGAKISMTPTEKSEAHGAVLAEWRF